MTGDDRRRIECEQPIEVAQVRVEVLGLLDVGDGVLDRVAGQQQPRLGVPEDDGVVAVDVDSDRLDPALADVQLGPVLEGAGGEDERTDPGRSLVLAVFDRLPVLAQQLGGAGAGEDLAVAEGGVAGEVVEVPVVSRTVNRLTPSASSAARIRRPCSGVVWVS